jgi:hypothetical protein
MHSSYYKFAGEAQRWFIYHFYLHLKKYFLAFRTILPLPAAAADNPFSPILVREGFPPGEVRI